MEHASVRTFLRIIYEAPQQSTAHSNHRRQSTMNEAKFYRQTFEKQGALAVDVSGAYFTIFHPSQALDGFCAADSRCYQQTSCCSLFSSDDVPKRISSDRYDTDDR